MPFGRLLSGAAMAAAVALAVSTAAADECSYGPNHCTPARPTDKKLWGELQPTDTYPYPPQRDHTAYDTTQLADGTFELWDNIDTTGGFLFTSSSCCVEVWSTQPSPTKPQRVGIADGWTGYGSKLQNSDWPSWQGLGHVVMVVHDVAVPHGDPTIAVSGGESGTLIWDTSGAVAGSSFRLPAYYQDGFDVAWSVWATTVGSKEFAFATSQSHTGIRVYSLDAARKLSKCLEGGGKAAGPAYGTCAGVYLGILPAGTSVDYLDGVGDVLVASTTSGRLELWDLSGLPALPGSPILSTTPPQQPWGVAMWKDNAHDYLGVRETQQAQIFDVTACVQKHACSSLGAALATISLDFQSARQPCDFSRSGSTPFLFFGQSSALFEGVNDEALYDVSDPSHPRSVTPPQTIVVSAKDAKNYPNLKDFPIGYWGWYAAGNPTGFNWAIPFAAVFHGPYLYRASYSLFDIHKWNGPPSSDAGTPSDAGTSDSGMLDGGAGDSALPDAASTHGTKGSSNSGCGCRAAGGRRSPLSAGLAILLSLGVPALVARRRSAGRKP